MIVQGTESQTFLFADLAGYTALTEAHGDEHAAEAAAAFYAEVRALLPEYDALEIKAMGDALMLVVPRPDRAVTLGTRIMCETGVRDRSLGIRIGMHTGPAVQRGGDWFGAAVNLAARVAAHARAGEVLLTEATSEAAQAHGAVGRVIPRGAHQLKNVSERVEIFAVDLSGHDRPEFARDPVCRMALDPDRAEHRAVRGGVTYHFCSPRCAEAFRAEPQRYTRTSTRGELLVSDRARERAAGRVRGAFRRGRIDELEMEARAGRVYSARSRTDLQAATQDLPRRRRRSPAVRLWRWIVRILRPSGR